VLANDDGYATLVAVERRTGWFFWLFDILKWSMALAQ
jgi:hypothetical protein